MLLLDKILLKIQEKNPNHAAKLRANLAHLGDDFSASAHAFLQAYERYLWSVDLTLDFGVDCYLHMIDDMFQERLKFLREGRYSNASFEDVERSVYQNREVMTYHMHGLVLAQFLWFDQYERILFFKDHLKDYFDDSKSYLEIGGGHGLYAFEATHQFAEVAHFDLVDISQSSLDLARGILGDRKINFYHKNIFDFSAHQQYHFITMGEVLEHLENPLQMLQKIGQLLLPDGVCYLTTPINAPMIDHIYLFSNEDEIRNLLDRAGFKILREKSVISEKISEQQAQKLKVPVMYAAFIQKK